MNHSSVLSFRPFLFGCFIPLLMIVGCEDKGEKSSKNSAASVRSGLTKRERGQAVAPALPSGPLIDAEWERFDGLLQEMGTNRGKFLDLYFSESPLDGMIARISLDEFLDRLNRHQIVASSSDERALLRRYFVLKADKDLAACVQLLRDRHDPELANACIGPIAGASPETAVEIVYECIDKGSLRTIALMNLFNVAARGDFERAARLANSLENAYDRGMSVTEVLSNPDVTMVPVDLISSLILNNPETYGGRDLNFAVQAIRHYPVPTTLSAFDMEAPWQRKLVLAYLVDRGRSAKEDVRDYVDSEAGKQAFNEEERKTVMATFGSNVYPAGGHHGK